MKSKWVPFIGDILTVIFMGFAVMFSLAGEKYLLHGIDAILWAILMVLLTSLRAE